MPMQNPYPLVCLRCGHAWISRKTDGTRIRECPNCKSRLWDIPRAQEEK